MRKRSMFFACLSSLLIFGLGFFWFSNERKTNAHVDAAPNAFASINQKAKIARSGNSSSVKELVDEVFTVTQAENYLAGFTSSTTKNRLAQAEIRYRKNARSGVSDKRVIRAVNGLVEKLNLPPFAKTNSYEVKKLRLSLVPIFPQLISRTDNSQNAAVSEEMSPVEAFFVTAMLFQQKLANEEYQITHSERVSNWNQIENRRQEEDRKNFLRQLTNGRGNQLRGSLQNGFSELPAQELVRIPKRALDILGIDE